MPEPIRIAVAALVREGRLLLVHRHPLRANYPDCWDLVGGHIEPGESPEQAVIRECSEELGVQIRDPRPVPYRLPDPRLQMHAFVVTQWLGQPVNLEPDEHDDLAWFDADQVGTLKIAHEASRPDLLALLQSR